MKKSDLVSAMSKEFKITQDLGKSYVDFILNKIGTSMVEGDDVKFVGFGTFSVSKRFIKIKHPTTGKIMEMDDVKIIRFKPAKHLKELVRGK